MTVMVPQETEADIPEAAADALLAAALVVIGSCIRGRLLFVVGLPVTLIGFAVASRSMWRVDEGTRVAWRSSTSILLAIMAALGLMAPITTGTLWYDLARRAYFVLVLGAAAALGKGHGPWRRRAVVTLTVAAGALHLAGPIGIPDPEIDTWAWTQSCLKALFDGVHPYTVQARDIIHGAFYEGRTAAVYPYPPLTLVAYAPVYALLRDYRFMNALCLPATVALNRAIGRRVGLGRELIDATNLILLCHPRGSWLTTFGWTEPLLVLTVAGFVFLAVRAPAGFSQALTFLLLPALKQYFAAPILLFLSTRRVRPRPLKAAGAAALAIATMLPFVWWNWRATIAGLGVQVLTLREPRLDSTSVVALVRIATGVSASRWLSLVTQFMVAGVAYAKLHKAGLSGLMLASTLSLYATFLTGWQAFENYYYLVGAMLVLTAILLAAPESAGWGPTTRRKDALAIAASSAAVPDIGTRLS